MKILFYYPGSLRNRRRGTPLRVYAIYESLRKLADVYLVARELPEDARERSMALEPPRKGLDWLLQTRVLRRAAREFRPDLFYGHTHLAILPLLLAAGRHAKTCVDLHGLPHHELGLQGVHKWATAGWHRMLIKRLTGITAVCDPLTRFYRGDAASGFTFHGGVDGQAMEALTPAAIDKSAGSCHHLLRQRETVPGHRCLARRAREDSRRAMATSPRVELERSRGEAAT